MQFRKFGKLDFAVSALGFGCMRLPTDDNISMSGNVDEKAFAKMLHYGIDLGINYVDTAYSYHKEQSEVFVGKVLKGGYRKKVKIATKLPVWLVNSADDFDKFLNSQLKKLQTDHIDFYLFHALGTYPWKKVMNLNLLKKAEDAIKDGRIGHTGFSFHDNFSSFKEIIDGYDKWDFCQIQYNYMDIENQAGIKGLKYASEKGLAVVLMEPLLGGRLARIPENIKNVFNESKIKRSPADWALQWLWDQHEVSTVLSGMTFMEQVEENIISASNSAVNSFMPEDKNIIDRVRNDFKDSCPVPCTKCGYCLPCPNGVNIPGVFELYNQGVMYKDVESVRNTYKHWIGNKERANHCIQCKACESKCPQKIIIGDWMPKVHGVLGEGKNY